MPLPTDTTFPDHIGPHPLDPTPSLCRPNLEPTLYHLVFFPFYRLNIRLVLFTHLSTPLEEIGTIFHTKFSIKLEIKFMFVAALAQPLLRELPRGSLRGSTL